MSDWIKCPKCGTVCIGFNSGYSCPSCGYRLSEKGFETINVEIDENAFRSVQLTELTDESIDRIADAIVQKLWERSEHK